MAVGYILDFAEGSADKYDEVVRRMELNGQTAPGGLFHAAGSGPKGGWRVVDVWEDDATFNAFAESKIMPITQAVGLGQPAVTRFEVRGSHDTDETGGDLGDITFVQVASFTKLDEADFRKMDDAVLAEGLPSGMIYHVNGPTPGGGWIVADAWSSKQERDRFLEQRLFPLAAQHPELTPPQIEDLEVHNVLRRATTAAASR